MPSTSLVKFLDRPMGCYARFEISVGLLPNGHRMERIIVAHEGRFWIEPNGMKYYPKYNSYEQVQEGLGQGLTFITKEYSSDMERSLFEYAITYRRPPKRSLFEYTVGYPAPIILAVPATGEEIYFDIYGIDQDRQMYRLFHGEL